MTSPLGTLHVVSPHLGPIYINVPLYEHLFDPFFDCVGSGRGGRQFVYSYEDKYCFARILKSDSLIFDSHFESGNLHSAFRVLHSNLDIYDLYMHDDINTTGHRQWFYFSVKNTRCKLFLALYLSPA